MKKSHALLTTIKRFHQKKIFDVFTKIVSFCDFYLSVFAEIF